MDATIQRGTIDAGQFAALCNLFDATHCSDSTRLPSRPATSCTSAPTARCATTRG